MQTARNLLYYLLTNQLETQLSVLICIAFMMDKWIVREANTFY